MRPEVEEAGRPEMSKASSQGLRRLVDRPFSAPHLPKGLSQSCTSDQASPRESQDPKLVP